MIVKPTITELLKITDDRYSLIIMTSRRARQIALRESYFNSNTCRISSNSCSK